MSLRKPINAIARKTSSTDWTFHNAKEANHTAEADALFRHSLFFNFNFDQAPVFYAFVFVVYHAFVVILMLLLLLF